ncbi:unnamed protein product [Sympodiomycopsis kandeliae]
MAPAVKDFFSSSTYAIAGASKDPNKIGNKVSTALSESQDLAPVQGLLSAVSQSKDGESQTHRGQSAKLVLESCLNALDTDKRSRLGEEYCDVVKWYKEHGFEAVPIHPKESSVEELHTVASVFDLPDAHQTSLSIITPPQVSLPILKTSLLELEIPWIWLQPGAEDDAIRDWVEALPDEDLKKRVIFGGPCILVEGEKLAKAEGKL